MLFMFVLWFLTLFIATQYFFTDRLLLLNALYICFMAACFVYCYTICIYLLIAFL